MKITLDNISKVYESGSNQVTALKDISLEIPSGEFFFLLGPSGCGKTTLLRLIAGLLKPTSGKIMFNDKDVTDLPVDKRKTAMVFQGYALWPHMTVQQNVEFGPKMQGLKKKDRISLASQQLERVQMDKFSRRKPNQLSGGQQQRVALARALAARVECLLLDEPLSNLDAGLRLHMRDELRHIVKSSGTTAIYVTHDQKESLSMADRIALMDAGHIVQVGRPKELYDSPVSKFVAGFLGEANFIEGRLIEKGVPAVIETPLGKILASDSRNIAVDTEVTCCIRPERITLITDKGYNARENEGLIPVEIISDIYLGEMREYLCSPVDKKDIQWKVFVLADLTEGLTGSGQIFLRFNTEDVVLLTD
jgi:iron(III) transport system ATP-binding protein